MNDLNAFQYSVPYSPMISPKDFRKLSEPLWMDTIYFYFQEDFHSMEVGHSFRSKRFNISGLVGDFYLAIEKNITCVVFGLHWAPLVTSDKDFHLSIAFTMIESLSNSKLEFMDFASTKASASFDLDEIQNHNAKNVLKLVIWMEEYKNLQISTQERALQDRVRLLYPSQQQYEDMSLLLDRPGFQGILYGRQSEGFAFAKTTLILRTFTFADELARKLRCFQNKQTYESVADISMVLGFIHHGEMRKINKEECLILYMRSVHFGLLFLKRECAEFIVAHINDDDVDFIVRAVVIVELVDDKILLNKVMAYFVRNKAKILESAVWNNLSNQYSGAARSIIETSNKMSTSDGVSWL